jgi:predicted nucleic acid-binding protein
MPTGAACLLDSNILLRISQSNDPQHAAISQALHALVGQGVRLFFTSQTLGEMWPIWSMHYEKAPRFRRSKPDEAPPPLRYAVQGFAPLRRR